jgi:ornithine cyclodeaminase/alanine dehydrogenase-like protein (mu-crystallin family)
MSIDLTYLNGPDVAALALTDDEILAAVEGGLRAQGLGQTVLEPRVHLVPESSSTVWPSPWARRPPSTAARISSSVNASAATSGPFR